MSARECINKSEEKEEMVRRVGGRGTRLVQTLLRMRRERAGRASQNLEQTPNWTGLVVHEVGPHGCEVERRLGGLQARGRRNRAVDSSPRTGVTGDTGQQTYLRRLKTDPDLE